MQHRRFMALLIAAAGLLALLPTATLAQQRVALVIGNASYAHAPRLANPLNDAADIGAALTRLGFAVTKLENADFATLLQGLLAFTRAAAVAEVAVVFYAGHGIEVDQRNFLVPVDAKLVSDQEVEFETVPLELVTRSVARASGLRLVILDACRENPFAVSMQRAGATRAIGRGLARVEPAGETLVAYAAKEGTVAADGEGRNSPYSEALLSHLEEPGLEVGLMFRKVRDAVLATTGGGQEPFVYGSLSSRGVYLTARLEPEPTPSPAPPTSMSESVTERLTAEELAAERVFWESVKDSTNAADFEAYLSHYPQGRFASLARNRLAALQRPDTPPALPEATAESMEAGLELSRADRRLIQSGLVAEGFDPGPADGLFGRGTRGAIGGWQSSRGDESTGYLDMESAKVLLAAGRAQEQAAARQAAAEAERLRREEEARERAQREAEERARQAKAEAERQRREQQERDRAARERSQRERLAREAAERVRAACPGWNTMDFFLYNDSHESVLRCLSAGADPNERDASGWTPLSHAAFHSKNPEVFRVLLEAGADPLARVKVTWEMYEELVEAGVDDEDLWQATIGDYPAMYYVVFNTELARVLSKLPKRNKASRLIDQAVDRIRPLLGR